MKRLHYVFTVLVSSLWTNWSSLQSELGRFRVVRCIKYSAHCIFSSFKLDNNSK